MGIISLIVIMLSCKKAEELKEKDSPANSGIITLTEESLKLIDLRIEEVGYKSIPIEFSASGGVGFNEKRLVHITSRVSGWVEKVYVFEGDKVDTGDSLVSIYSPEFLSAQAEFIQAEERLKKISESDSIEYHTALALYQSAKVKLLLLGATEKDAQTLEDTHHPSSHLIIKSPLAGTIIESNVVVGNVVEKGANLFRVSDLSSLWVTANVYEKDIRLVKRGQKVQVKVSSFPDKIFPGTVEAINDVLDETTRTFKVRIEVDNRSGDLRPEMFCECVFKGELRRELLAIPISSVQTMGEEKVIFVPQGQNSFEKRVVKTGEEIGDYVEILEGLKVREKFVNEGSFILKSELLKSEFGEE
jgi:Cu(I)/Ag(I) efflux system membrane fusion protein